ncbi:hypothetical protein E05_11940 [Plautia stali symbiont]|nr:hypothetical protein E05_11940 [Plautia stali symbiont]
MQLSTDIINLFLETKDIMQEQLDAYKTAQEPNAESFNYICEALRQLALEATIDGVGKDDIVAVLCFVIDEAQIQFPQDDAPAAVAAAPVAEVEAEAPVQQTATVTDITPAVKCESKRAAAPAKSSESSSIRVAVEKVDQLINLVGELVITQSMLAQCSGALDPVAHGDLLNSMGQLERNARDLQESVMSIRMMPMEYVFSRFPRLVRDLASKLGKRLN